MSDNNKNGSDYVISMTVDGKSTEKAKKTIKKTTNEISKDLTAVADKANKANVEQIKNLDKTAKAVQKLLNVGLKAQKDYVTEQNKANSASVVNKQYSVLQKALQNEANLKIKNQLKIDKAIKESKIQTIKEVNNAYKTYSKQQKNEFKKSGQIDKAWSLNSIIPVTEEDLWNSVQSKPSKSGSEYKEFLTSNYSLNSDLLKPNIKVKRSIPKLNQGLNRFYNLLSSHENYKSMASGRVSAFDEKAEQQTLNQQQSLYNKLESDYQKKENQKRKQEEKRTKSEDIFTQSLNKFATGFSTLFGVGYSLSKAKNFIEQSYHEATSLGTLLRYTGDDAKKAQILNATLARYDPDNPNGGYEAMSNIRQNLLSAMIDQNPAFLGKGSFIYNLQPQLQNGKLKNPADIIMAIREQVLKQINSGNMSQEAGLAFLSNQPFGFSNNMATSLLDKKFGSTYNHVSGLPQFSEKNLQDAKELENTWQDITQSMKVATMELMPLFKAIAQLAKVIAPLIHGTVSAIKSTGDSNDVRTSYYNLGNKNPIIPMNTKGTFKWSDVGNYFHNIFYKKSLNANKPTLSNIPASTTKSNDWLTNALPDLAPSIEDTENSHHLEMPGSNEGAMQVTGGTASDILGIKNTSQFRKTMIKNHRAQVYVALKKLQQCGVDTINKMGLSSAGDDILNANKNMIYANMGTCYNGNTNPLYAQNLMNNYDKNQASGRVTIDITSSDGTISQYNQNAMLDVLQRGDEIRKAVANAVNPTTSQGAIN